MGSNELRIINEYPPNIADIQKVFPLAMRKRGVVFSYGDAIYNPSGEKIPLCIVEHEWVHCQRQQVHEGGVAGWWKQYLEDPQFRLMEELLAHRAEYRSLIKTAPNRKLRRASLKIVAQKLAAPLYGGLINSKTAESWISEEVEADVQPA